MPVKSSSLANIFKGGIDEKALQQRANASRSSGDRLGIAKGETKLVQFYGETSNEDYWLEFPQHVWKSNGKWNFIPCIGPDNGCARCASDEEGAEKTSPGFIAAVWSFKDKGPKVLTGPMGLLTRIVYRYRRASDRFLRRTWEITRLNTEKTDYDVSQGEDRPINLSNHEAIDLRKWLITEYEKYAATVSKAKKSRGPSTLDDYDDEEDEDEEIEDDSEEEDGPTEDDLMDKEEYPLSELKKYAKEVGVKITPEISKNRITIVKKIIRARGY